MRRIIWFIIGLLSLVLLAPKAVMAAGADFSVLPIFPGNPQPAPSYFNLTVQPGQKVPLAAQISNTSTHKVTLTAEIVNAVSQSNGEIGYFPNSQRDDSAAVTLTAITPGPTTITLDPKSSKTVTFTATIPQAGFRGELLGALFIKNPSPTNPQSQIKNQFAYVVGVRLRMNNDPVPPELVLKRVAPAVQDNKIAVVSQIQNRQPRFFGGLVIDATLTKAGQTEAVAKRHVTGFAMAPNSTLPFGLFPKTLTPGDYTVAITASAGKYHWSFKQNFSVSAAQVTKLAQQTNQPMPNTFPWGWLALGFGLFVLLGLLFFIIWRKRRRRH